MFVTTIGHGSIPPDANYPSKSHPSSYWFKPGKGRILHEYQLIYITKGQGVFESASCKSSKIFAGTIILLFPGEWHTYRPSTASGWDEYWIGFNSDYFSRLVTNNFFSKEVPFINIGFNEQIVSLFMQAAEIANLQKTAHQQMLAGITNLLISTIFYAGKNNSFRDKEIIAKINKARMMMRENNNEKITPESIASSLNQSYSWFRRIFKEYTGFSPAQYQMEIKIQKSKELLTSTTMPVKEIAYDLNFESLSYFITFFKSRTNVSPSEYRKNVHKITE